MSWEIERMRKPRVAVCIMAGEEMIFRDMHKAAMALQREPGWVFFYQSSIPVVDMARNVVVSQALHSGADYVFLWDIDVTVPPDIVPRLMSHGLPVVSALYDRSHPGIFPEVFRVDNKGIPKPLSREEVNALRGQLIECDAVGLGCCLIHRSVLEKLADRSTKFNLVSPENPGEKLEVINFMEFIMVEGATVSEDVNLCSRIRNELGFKIFCDLGIECGHLTTAEIKGGKMDFPALEYGRER